MNNALDSPTAISSSTRSLQKCIRSQSLTYTCTTTSPVRFGMGHLSPVLDSSPSTSYAAQTGITQSLQDRAVAVPSLIS